MVSTDALFDMSDLISTTLVDPSNPFSPITSDDTSKFRRTSFFASYTMSTTFTPATLLSSTMTLRYITCALFMRSISHLLPSLSILFPLLSASDHTTCTTDMLKWLGRTLPYNWIGNVPFLLWGIFHEIWNRVSCTSTLATVKHLPIAQLEINVHLPIAQREHMKDVYFLIPGSNRTWLYPAVKSNTVKYLAVDSRLNISSMNGNGYAIFLWHYLPICSHLWAIFLSQKSKRRCPCSITFLNFVWSQHII